MIITKISDGFGNQLFMYACGYAAAKRLGTKLLLDISYLATNDLRNYELDNLNIKYDSFFSTDWLRYAPLKILYRKAYHAYIKRKYSFFQEKTAYIYDPNVQEIKDNTYLFGYWQSEKYFIDSKSDLIQMFTPNKELSDGCKRYISMVQNCNSVAIHVRQGDYVDLGICLGTTYYDNSIKKMEQETCNVCYFVFSDDIEYAKELFKNQSGRFEYVQYEALNPTIEDFFIMKECKHMIMANSSFSWWAAWLNKNLNKIVIYPGTNLAASDFYPHQWTMIV